MKLLLLIVIVFLFVGCNAEPRYVSMAWRRVGTGTTVEFLLGLSIYSESFIPGQVYPINGHLYTGDGNQVSVEPVVTQSVTHSGLTYFATDLAIPYRYASTGTYTAYLSLCCRPAALLNNAADMIRVETTVNLASGVAGSPIPISIPTLTVFVDAGQAGPATFSLVAENPGGAPLTWRLASTDPPSEMTGTTAAHPAGFAVAASALEPLGRGEATWTGVGALGAGLYSTQIVVEDGYGKASMDVVLDLQHTQKHCHPSCLNADAACGTTSDCLACSTLECNLNNPPAFTWPTPGAGQVLTVDPCAPLHVRVLAEDPDADDNVTVLPSALPVGMAVVKAEGGNPLYQKYAWSPSRRDAGTHPICFVAWDHRGRASEARCFFVAVLATVCSDHGDCIDGQCQCFGQWTGPSCDRCLDGWFGPQCAQKYGGPVYAFGSNAYGQLGQLYVAELTATPAEVTETLAGLVATRVAAGGAHSHVVTAGHRVFSFGSNEFGQLGYGLNADNQTLWGSAAPLEVTPRFGHAPDLLNVTMIAAGAAHSIALTADGRVFTWGSNAHGQLGRNETWGVYYNRSSIVPVDVTAQFPEEIRRVAAGADFCYALSNASRVYAWGRNDFGQLATGDTEDRLGPTDVTAAFPEPIADVAAGESHVLALGASGGVYVVGSNSHGQLGVNDTMAGLITVPQALPQGYYDSQPVVKIGAGNLHSFVQTNGTELWAFGSNEYGQLAVGNLTSYWYPVQVPRAYYNWARITKFALGHNFTLLLTEKHQVWACGSNQFGQLGLNSTVPYTEHPEMIYDSFNNGLVQDVQAGARHALIILQNEEFDNGKTLVNCFPTVQGHPTNCLLRLFDTRGYPFGGAEHATDFRVLNVKGGDGNDICPPPDDRPQFLGPGRYMYTWVSPSAGRGGRFQVAFGGQPLLVYNNTHNARYAAMREAVHGYDLRNPLKTPEYLDRLKARDAPPDETELFLFFEPTDRYDMPLGPELVVNGDAEAGGPGAIADWTPLSGTWAPREAGPAPGWNARYFAVTSAAGQLEQIVDVSALATPVDAGAQMFYFSAQAFTVDEAQADTGRVVVQYRTAGGAVLDTFDTGALSYVGAWTGIADMRQAPALTRDVRIALEVQNMDAATPTQFYFDHVSLRAATVRLLPGYQRDALVELYTATAGAGWFDRRGWVQGDPCKNFWTGVTCRFQSVVRLELAQNNLKGPLPSSISALTDLEVLDLSGNQLSGPLPANVTHLRALRQLVLTNNSLTGLPDDLSALECLWHLRAARNALAAIPATLGQMFRLRTADLSYNSIASPIPPLSNMPRLETLQLQRNAIPGPIPAAIGLAAPRLQSVDLAHNRLESVLPDSLGNLTALHSFHASHNLLSGEIPDSLAALPQLATVTLSLDHNALTGTIPAFLAGCRAAYLSANNFSCPVQAFASIYDAQYLTCHDFVVTPQSPDLSFEKSKMHDEL